MAHASWILIPLTRFKNMSTYKKIREILRKKITVTKTA